ncbi:hypothetical protein LEN_1029 [Lysobacter enzymogenes]|uniref:Uncharacterized protein n=1 Tax=Lysobacter enzymogenes TaxID=69 RepID=A0AAU9ACU5_LYSEN|nr:hypothetical protein LEN_1029 [Lysobacter enzymogenes]
MSGREGEDSRQAVHGPGQRADGPPGLEISDRAAHLRSAARVPEPARAA